MSNDLRTGGKFAGAQRFKPTTRRRAGLQSDP
jgi:hypothetical protein